MKKLFLLLIISFLFFSPLDSQIKRVLLEQHTGAWCGWCVDGTVMMDSILALYPDQVIGVKVHNGDSMAIPEQGTIASGIGLTGYPSGTIDRKKYGNVIPQNRGDWKQYCESQIAQSPKLDINVAYNINTASRQLMVKVYANMLVTVYDPLRFNVIISEDSVTGTGTGWDQSNYLSGRSGYENNPYYKLPSKIVGYHHMKVVRAYLGGAWGVQGSFTQPASQGQVYTHEFSYTLPDNWNIDHIKIVGFVQIDAPAVKEVLNCAYGVKGETKLQLTSTGSSKEVIDPNNAFNKDFTLKNVTANPLTYKVSWSTSPRTPAGWKAEINGMSINDEITLNANEEKTLTLSMIPDETIGIGDASIRVSVKDDPDAFSGNGTITVYSSRISNIEVINAGEATYALSPTLNAMGFDNYYQLSAADYSEMGPKFNRKTMIWNTGSTEYPTGDDVSSILEAIQSKVPVFVCGNQMASALGNNNALTVFNAEYNGYSTQGYGTSPWRVWLAGVNGDPITDKYGNTIEGNLIKYLITLVKITDSQKTTPFMTFANAGLHVVYNSKTGQRDTYDIQGPDAIFGIKVDKGDQRFALLSITPYVIVNKQIRNNIVANVIRWINNIPTDYDTPQSDVSSPEIYPVPAQEHVLFTYPLNKYNSIRIYNLLGLQVDEINIKDSSDSYNYLTSKLTNGIYYAVFSNGNIQTTTQFTIVK